MLRLLVLAILLAGPASAAAAASKLDAAEVRAFVARQSKAWNAKQLSTFYGLFTPDAVFIDQARAPNGQVFPYGSSTRAEAEAQTRRALADGRPRERTAIRSITIAPDGGSAMVVSEEVSEITAGGRTRRSCAERLQTIVATPQGPRSKGQTDNIVRCR
jgi:ketosteroid isomerase-like protein